ncbi:Usg family protein [Rhodovibrio salinarum]
MARRLGKQLDGYRLTVAEIFYRLPDHPSLLQTFIWQDYDLIPKYPVLHGFLTFWRENLDGELHSVRVASRELVAPDDIRVVDAHYTLQ